MEGGGGHLPRLREICAKDNAPSWGGRSMHVGSLGGEAKSLAVDRALAWQRQTPTLSRPRRVSIELERQDEHLTDQLSG